MRRLLVDTDIFCKLGIARLLEPAVAILGFALSDCRALPPLPHMLRKGKLPKLFGVEACTSLVPLAESMSSGAPISTASLEKLTPIDRIDVGEAQLLAAVADLGDLLLTGDKRALVAVGQLPNFPPLLAGKIATMEAVLISLCSKLGGDAVCAAVQPIIEKDQMIRACLSPGSGDPRIGLRSYFESLKREVAPLELWKPVEGAS
jgi:hypothetical protein